MYLSNFFSNGLKLTHTSQRNALANNGADYTKL